LQRCKHVNRNSNHLQEHLLLLSLRNQATPNAPRDHQNASSGDLISGERRTALVLEVLAARGRSSFLFSQLQQCENDFRSNPKLRSAILENGEESRRIVRRDNKLGADYGQFPVRGTPFVDPPLRENMTAAPLPGAKALPFASHVDTVMVGPRRERDDGRRLHAFARNFVQKAREHRRISIFMRTRYSTCSRERPNS
jgi:hypothetical protein